MKKIIGISIIWLFLCWTGRLSAAAMPPITVSGVDWLQPIDFINLSWNEISTVCNTASGACSGSLVGVDLTGWSWANNAEVQAMIMAFTGFGPLASLTTTNSVLTGTNSMDAFLSAFLPQGLHSNAVELQGWTREANDPGGGVDRFRVVAYRNSSDFATDFYSLQSGPSTNGPDVSVPEIGGFFYRSGPSTTVPSPATALLLGLGLAALVYAGRKKELYRYSN